MDIHAVRYLWLNAQGRYLRQRLLAQALRMAVCCPTVLILAEAHSSVAPEDPPFLDYTRQTLLPPKWQEGGRFRCLCPFRDHHPSNPALGPLGCQCALDGGARPVGKAACASSPCPQINIGCEPYVRWWAMIWREVTREVDPASALVLANTNSTTRPADRGTLRPLASRN